MRVPLATSGSLSRPESASPRFRVGIDAVAVAGATGLIVLAAIVGSVLNGSSGLLGLPFPPVVARWQPHLGPGTVPALLLAAGALTVALRWSVRLSWPRLLGAAYLTCFAWTCALALVDGYRTGWAGRLATVDEYLHDLPHISGVQAFLRGFSGHIVDFRPDSWTTHVSSHPPLTTLLFYSLDRIGLPGGGWAGLLVVLVGASAPVAVAVTFRVLGAESAARRALPLMVFAPAAIWVGVSADGLFAGVAAWSVAAMAVSVTARTPRRGVVLAFAGGLLFGTALYLSYGLLLIGIVVLAAIWLAARGSGRVPWRQLLAGSAGLLVVAVPFTLAGFLWWEGLAQLRIRYYQGVAAVRPYGYFLWADVAALCLATGPAAVAGLARAVRRLRRPTRCRAHPAVVLPLAAALAVLLADVSGMSKGETERIWLPFAGWLIAAVALAPSPARRWLLAGQVGVALVVNHVLLTNW